MLSIYRIRKFGTPILKCIKGSIRTKTNQSVKSNLSVEKLRSKVAIARKWGSAYPSHYYCLINGKRIGKAIFSEMENMMSIITDHIKYLEVHQLRNMKSAPDISPTWANLQIPVSGKYTSRKYYPCCFFFLCNCDLILFPHQLFHFILSLLLLLSNPSK